MVRFACKCIKCLNFFHNILFKKSLWFVIPVIFLLLMLATKLPQVASSRNQMHLCHCRREQICLHWSLGHRIILHPLRSPGNWVWCPYSTKKYIWQIYGMFDEYNQYIAHVMVWSVWYVDCRHLIAISVDKAHIYSDSGGLGLNPSLVHYYSLILSHTHTQCIKHSLNVLNLRTYLYVHFIIERWWMISSLFITTVLEKSGLKPGAMIWLVRMVSII